MRGFITSLIAVSVASAGLALQAEAAKASKVNLGIVDMQLALRTVKAGKKARSMLEKKFNKKKEELQKEEGNLKKMTAEFQKQSMVLSDKARAKKQLEIQQRILKFQEKTQRSQLDIQREEQKLTKPIIMNLKKIVSAVAKRRGYSMVIEKNASSVLYNQAKDDLTNEVIKVFNKKHKS